jgi:hypothetical protein
MADGTASEPTRNDWRRETSVVAGALLVGLVLLPLTIWAVGQALIGPYEGGEGALALAETLWLDALALKPAAWLLVLSPYALTQLCRLVWRAWRG